MESIENYIAKCILNALDDGQADESQILEALEIPKDEKNGDLTFPCFRLSKVLKDSPVNIANNLKSKLVFDDKVKKVEVIGGYLNFYLDNSSIYKDVLNEAYEKGLDFGKDEEGKDKTVVIDYSSPNIAKPFHLGHFRNTVIGASLYNLYKNFGYKTVGINYLGDWGRQFGLLIEGYKLYKDEYDIDNEPLKSLSDIYVRISRLAKEDENVMNRARENFKMLEQGDETYSKLWEYFREVSLKEYERIYDLLGIKFDSYNGEAFYNDKMDEVIDILEKKHVLEQSEGAKVVNVGDDMPPCIVLKSNGSTIYATRDLAAILYRARNYDFDKAIYVTGSEQILHFKQVFEVAKYLVDEKYKSGLVHVPYGMIRLKTGKMSTREGNVIYVNDLMNEAVAKSKKIMEDKNKGAKVDDKVCKQVGIGALIFNYLKTGKIKDIVFDLDETLRFDGETGPYVQYTYVRTKSIIEKSGMEISDLKDADIRVLTSDEEVCLIKDIAKYKQILKKSLDECEPAYIARYLIESSTDFSRFYNEHSVLNCDEKTKKARLYLTYLLGTIIKSGLSILGIECPDKM